VQDGTTEMDPTSGGMSSNSASISSSDRSIAHWRQSAGLSSSPQAQTPHRIREEHQRGGGLGRGALALRSHGHLLRRSPSRAPGRKRRIKTHRLDANHGGAVSSAEAHVVVDKGARAVHNSKGPSWS
jgi:hypothetical protein